MTQESSDVEPDLSHIHWSWPEAIAANPACSLATADLAMDYFAYSPFFDTNSNNSVLRTQRRVENPAYGHAEEKIELNAFRSGFEYIVAHAQPPEMFIIHRRAVQMDGSRASVSAAYFILQEKVYPTPTLYGVMAARLRNASHLVSSTFSALSAAHPSANPRATSQWRSLPPSAPSDNTALQNTDEDVDMEPVASTSTPAANLSAQPTITKKKTTKPPDYHLFNALQSTRLALTDLGKMAGAPAVVPDSRDELRAIEAQIMGGKQKTGAGGRGVGGARGGLGGGGGGTPSVRGVAGSPGVSVAPGRAGSIGTSGMGQSPAVR